MKERQEVQFEVDRGWTRRVNGDEEKRKSEMDLEERET